jgi:hypothetical protein
MKDKIETAITAAALANSVSQKATDLASTAVKTATELAATTAETNRQITEKVTEVSTNVEWMKKSLVVIENKLDDMSKSFVSVAQHQEVLISSKDHEDRIRKIEQQTWIWVGGLAVLSLKFNYQF